MTRPTVARISRAALENNLQVMRSLTSGRKIWSVVKANAYGHRLEHTCPGLNATDGFGMINLEDAILLRERGWKGPILMLEGFFHADELALFDQYRLTTSIHSNWQIKALADARLKAPLDVYLKINSGMNRLGFEPARIHNLFQQLRAIANCGSITLMSHFADADKPEGVTAAMAHIALAGEGIDAPRSLANSAATLWHPETLGDWVRPGIVLYGASPSGRWQDIASCGLRPVMTLQSEIIAVQNLKPGDTVGYGSRYRASHLQRIGVVAVGYADGYPRIAPDGTPLAIDGVLSGTVGTISMDMMTVDLTPCPQAGIGSKVELWGENIKIDDVARACGTVGYELMCALAPRVPVVTV